MAQHNSIRFYQGFCRSIAVNTALVITLLCSVPAWGFTAQKRNVFFPTENHSIFAPGTGLDMQGSTFVGLEWGPQNFEHELPGAGASGFAAFQLDAGRVGFEAAVDTSSGVVDVIMPGSTFFVHLQQVEKGNTFELKTFRALALQFEPPDKGSLVVNVGYETVIPEPTLRPCCSWPCLPSNAGGGKRDTSSQLTFHSPSP